MTESDLASLREGPYPVGAHKIRQLAAAGWTMERLCKGTAYDILDVPGIGWVTACQVRANLREQTGALWDADVWRFWCAKQRVA